MSVTSLTQLLLLEQLRKLAVNAVFILSAWTKLRSVVSDRWETTYSCKSGARPASQATRPTHCSVRGNQTQWANHAARKGGVVEAEDIKRGEGEGAKLTWSWLSLCQMNSSACSVPSEASELGRWPGHPASNDLHCRQRVWALSLSLSLVHSHTLTPEA